MLLAQRVQTILIELHELGGRDGEEMKEQAETATLQLRIVCRLKGPHE